MGFQSDGDLVSQISQLRILHLTEEDVFPFQSENRLPLHDHKKNNNSKHVYRQSQMRKPTGCEVKWAECSLIMRTVYRVSSFSLMLDGSVGLWGGFQSDGDFVSQTSQLRIRHSAEEDNLSPSDPKIACLSQSIKISEKHVNRQRCLAFHVPDNKH